MSSAKSNPRLEVEGRNSDALLIDDVKRRCRARHDLRHGADPIKVAAALAVCVEDLADVLADWP